MPATVHFVNTTDLHLWSQFAQLLYELATFPHSGLHVPAPDELRRWLIAYDNAMRQVADAIVVAADGDTVFVHLNDLQMIGAVRYVREALPHARVIWFDHCPWMAPRVLLNLPTEVMDALLRSILAADMVAFHAKRWSARFRACCAPPLATEDPSGALMYDGRRILVGEFPLPPDTALWRGLASDAEVQTLARRLRQRGVNQVVVAGGRADPLKNHLRLLNAWRSFLRRRPELLGTVQLILHVQQTRLAFSQYRAYLSSVEKSCAEINQAFFRTRRTAPVRLFVENNLSLAAATYMVATVFVDATLIDGMPLLPEEVAIVNDHVVVVLSEGAGASDLLRGLVVGFDPENEAAIERALEAGLAMAVEKPDEAHTRALEIRRRVTRGLPEWLMEQLALLGYPNG